MLYRFLVFCLSCLLVACGGSGESSEPAPVVAAEVFYSISGVAQDIPGTVVLSFGDEQFFVKENGEFTLPGSFITGDSLNITVSSAPENYACVVENGDIVVDDNSVRNILVYCSRNAFSVGGGTFGLRGPVTLKLGDEEVVVSEDGVFQFDLLKVEGEDYKVELVSFPEEDICELRFEEGVVSGKVSSVIVLCRDKNAPELKRYFLRGKISDFLGEVQLQVNFPNSTREPVLLTLDDKKEDFTFPVPFLPLETYSVSVVGGYQGLCQTFSEEGTFNGADEEDLRVFCPLATKVSVTASGFDESMEIGLFGQQVRLSENLSSDLEQRIPVGLYDVSDFLNAAYDQSCSLSIGNSFIGNSFAVFDNTATMNLTCRYIASFISGEVEGLVGTVEVDVDGQSIQIESESYQYPRKVAHGNVEAQILSQPLHQECRFKPIAPNADPIFSLNFNHGAPKNDLDLLCADQYFALTLAAFGIEDSDEVDLTIERTIETDGNPENLSVSGSAATVLNQALKNETVRATLTGVPSETICEFEDAGITTQGLTIQRDTQIVINCRPDRYAVNVEVVGKVGVLGLQLAGQSGQLSQSQNTYQFPVALLEGDVATLSITQQPDHQTCVVENNDLVVEQGMASLAVLCEFDTFVTSVRMQNLLGDARVRYADESIDVSSSSTSSNVTEPFSERVEASRLEDFEVVENPEDQNCSITGFDLSAKKIGQVVAVVTCAFERFNPRFDVIDADDSITISILGNSYQLSNTAATSVSDKFSIAELRDLVIEQNPARQVCELDSDSFVDVDTSKSDLPVVIHCVDVEFIVSGTVSGLLDGTLELVLNDQSTSVTGVASTNPIAFSFPDYIPQGTSLSVGVTSSPTNYRCELTSAPEVVSSTMREVIVTCNFGGQISGSFSVPSNVTADSDINDTESELIPNDSFSTAQGVERFSSIHGFLTSSLENLSKGHFTGVDPTPDSTDQPADEFDLKRDETPDFKLDVYALELEKGQILSLSYEGLPLDVNTFDLDMFLYEPVLDPNGAEGYQLVGQAMAGPNEEERISAPDTGRYFLEIQAAGGAGRYVLDILAADASADSVGAVDSFNGLEVIVQFGSEDPHMRRIGSSFNGEFRHFERDRATLLTLNELNAEPASPLDQELSAYSPDQWDKKAMLQRVKEIALRSDVRFAQPNFYRQASDVTNDALIRSQWNLGRINMEDAWSELANLSDLTETVVAVIDSGVSSQHEDLQGRVLPGYDFISDSDKSLDGDGIDSDPEPPVSAREDDKVWHGSFVAGIIAAHTNNFTGIAGIAEYAQIMPLRVLGKDQLTASYDLVQSVLFAIGERNDSLTRPDKTADIINMSLSHSSASFAELEVFEQARRKGVILVASSGNDSTDLPAYPASYEGVISVGASTYQGSRAAYSNYGLMLDLMAPGGDIRTDLNFDGYNDGIVSTLITDGGSDYQAKEGTSFAAPHVTAVIALMKSIYPELTPWEVDSLISAGKLSNDMGPEGRDDLFGYGLIDASKAVKEAVKLRSGDLSSLPQELDVRFSRQVIDLGLGLETYVLSIRNGGLQGSITSVDSDETWFTLEEMEIDENGFGEYRVSLSTGLSEVQDYFGAIRITDSAGTTHRVLVEAALQTLYETRVGVPVYFWLFDDDMDLAGKTLAELTGYNEYRYSIDGVAPGTYTGILSSDIDMNGMPCEFAEICGSTMVDFQVQSLEIEWPALDLELVRESP